MPKTKILYVEDEPFLGRIVKESLESREFDVLMVTDGINAVSTFAKEKPDICVFDIMLPSRDGYSIAKDIRQMNLTVPIIFVTAKNQTDDVIKGFESGGNDYIRKPFSIEELIVRVNNLLKLSEHKNSRIPEQIVIGKSEFNPLRFELKFGAAVRKLSNRESTLLQLLSQNKNATILRKEILLKLWGDDSFFNSRNLNVYITKFRDYLKEEIPLKSLQLKVSGTNLP